MTSEITWYDIKMTSDSTPAPYKASAVNTYELQPYLAFNGTMDKINDCWLGSYKTNTSLTFDFGVKSKVHIFRLMCRLTYTVNQTMNTFDILGSNDGISFELIKKVQNMTTWKDKTYNYVELDKEVNYRYYRISNITKLNGSSTNYVAIGKFEFGYFPPRKKFLLKDDKYHSIQEGKVIDFENIKESYFINYGISDVIDFEIMSGKNYILQDTISEDTDGLWKQDLNRKPLSMKVGEEDLIKWFPLKMTSNNAPAPYVASASSSYGSGYEAWRAFDGDVNTLWTTVDNKASGAWIEIDFGKEVEVEAVSIRARNDGFYTQSPHVFYISYSSDKANYKTSPNISFQQAFSFAGQEQSVLFEKIKGRYFRLYNVTNGYASLGFSELKFGWVGEKKLVLKNPTTNQHYSLAEKTLIPLPNASSKNMILHGIEAGKEIRLDEDFDKVNYPVSEGLKNTIKTVIKPLSIKFE